MKITTPTRLRQWATPLFSLGLLVTFLLILLLVSSGFEGFGRLAVVG